MLTEISPKDVALKLAAAEDFILLDCREPEELELASIAGALHIPMGDIPSELPDLDPEKDYVIFCHHGVRSAHVALFLLSQDFDSVKNMRGGIAAWSHEVDPEVPQY